MGLLELLFAFNALLVVGQLVMAGWIAAELSERLSEMKQGERSERVTGSKRQGRAGRRRNACASGRRRGPGSARP